VARHYIFYYFRLAYEKFGYEFPISEEETVKQIAPVPAPQSAPEESMLDDMDTEEELQTDIEADDGEKDAVFEVCRWSRWYLVLIRSTSDLSSISLISSYFVCVFYFAYLDTIRTIGCCSAGRICSYISRYCVTGSNGYR
jgi:hypothetical protein